MGSKLRPWSIVGLFRVRLHRSGHWLPWGRALVHGHSKVGHVGPKLNAGHVTLADATVPRGKEFGKSNRALEREERRCVIPKWLEVERRS